VRPLVPAALLLLLLVFAPAASALPLEARVEGGTLVVELNEGSPASAQVVVTHQDERAWVDRVVRVDRAGPNATLRLDGLPRDVPLTVRVFDGALPLPTLPHAPAYLNASAIVAMNATLVAHAGAISSGGPTGRTLPAAVLEVGRIWARDLHVTQDGRLVLVTSDETQTLQLRVSDDAGRTWRGPVAMARGETSDPIFLSGVSADNALVLLTRTFRYVDDPNDYEPGYTSYEHWRYHRFNLTTLTLVAERTFTVDGMAPNSLHGDLVPLSDGSMLTFWSGALQTLDAHGREVAQTGGASGVNVLRIHRDGTATPLGEILGAGYAQSLRASVAPDGTIGLVGTMSSGMPNASMQAWVSFAPPSTSITAASFSHIRNVTVPFVPPLDRQVYAHSIAVDAARNAHVCVVWARFTGNEVVFESYLIRLAADGTLTGRDLRKATPTPVPPERSVSSCLVAASGNTVWAIWSTPATGHEQLWLQRSANGGATWQEPLLLRGFREPFTVSLMGSRAVGVLPDGRPVLQGGFDGQGLTLPYEPLQPAGSRLDRLHLGAPPAPPAPPRQAVDIVRVEPETLHIERGGDARLQVTLHNAGPMPVDVSLGFTSAVLLYEPSSLTLDANETVELSGRVRVAPSAFGAGSSVVHLNVVASIGSGASSRPITVSWEGEPGPTTPAPTAPPPSLPVERPPRDLPTTPAAPTPGAPLALVALAVALVALLRRP